MLSLNGPLNYKTFSGADKSRLLVNAKTGHQVGFSTNLTGKHDLPGIGNTEQRKTPH